MKSLLVLGAVGIIIGPLFAAAAPPKPVSQPNQQPTLRVGVAGSEPFVLSRAGTL